MQVFSRALPDRDEAAPAGEPSLVERLFLALLGTGLTALLGIAWWLEPDARGLGTHQQLGFPACTIRVLFGLRCPTCGMTTSWSHAMRGQWPSALVCNPGGAMLAATAMFLAPWSLISAARGRWWLLVPRDWMLWSGAIAIGAVTIIDWAARVLTGT